MLSEKRLIVERDCCELESVIRLPGRSDAIACKIVNLSMQGAGLELPADTPELPRTFSLMLPLIDDAADERHVELRWRDGHQAGVRFV